jgi:hypothetical protein
MLAWTFWESGIWNLESCPCPCWGKIEIESSRWRGSGWTHLRRVQPTSNKPPGPARMSAWVPPTGTPTRIQQRCSRERPRPRLRPRRRQRPCPWPWPLALAPGPGPVSLSRRSRRLAQPYCYWVGMGTRYSSMVNTMQLARGTPTYLDRRPPALDVASAHVAAFAGVMHASYLPTPAQPRRRPCCECEQ